MNREIKFRGLRLDKSEMVIGDLIHGVGAKSGKLFILPVKVNLAYIKDCHPLDGVEVSPESVGQFTGLKDKNGKEIYEGDILKSATKKILIVEWGRIGDRKEQEYFSNLGWVQNFPAQDRNCNLVGIESSTVIGNIYENSELLTQKESL